MKKKAAAKKKPQPKAPARAEPQWPEEEALEKRAYALELFRGLIDSLEPGAQAARRGFYASLLDEVMHECGAAEGSLLLSEESAGAVGLRLASVKGLSSEIWAGERGGLDQGPAGEAARSRQPVRRSESFGEVLCLPLIFKDSLLGVLALNRQEGEAFSDEELFRGCLAGEGLATALWAARHLSLQDEAERKLDALMKAGSAVIRERETSKVLERVIVEAQTLMDAEAASVFILDEARQELSTPVATGPAAEDVRQVRLKMGEGLVGWVAQSGEAAFIADAGQDPRFSPRVDKRTRFQTRNMACVPLKIEGKVVGALEVLNRRGGRTFDSTDLPVLQALGNLAAVAVESGRLYDQMKERTRALNAELVEANFGLNEAKNRLESVLFAMEEAVFAGDENGRVSLMNRAAQIIAFGVSHQDAAGRMLNEVIPHREFEEKLKETRASGQTQALELELDAPDSRTFAVVITPIKDLEGYLTGLVVVLRDVTRFKELERMKISFLNTVSHELRTPMTSIRAFSELMQKKQVAQEKMSEWAGIIFEEARRLGRLIDDLLDVSRIEAGKKLSINRRSVEILPLIRKTAALFQKDAATHPLNIEAEKGPETAELDPDRLEQILANLLSNAIKYSPKGGPVTLRLSPLENGWLRMEVADSGVGLTEVDRLRIWDKFYRAESKENVGIGGTGLGLSITRYLVEQHGGRVGVDSQLGKGSCFWLEMPATAPKEEPV